MCLPLSGMNENFLFIRIAAEGGGKEDEEGRRGGGGGGGDSFAWKSQYLLKIQSKCFLFLLLEIH